MSEDPRSSLEEALRDLNALAETAVRLAYGVPGAVLDNGEHVSDEDVSATLRRDRFAARALIELRSQLAGLADADPTCPDCGLTASRIGQVHITAQEAGRHRVPDPLLTLSDTDEAQPVPSGLDALGNDKGGEYAAIRRVDVVLDEAVLSGALSPEERRSVRLVSARLATATPPADEALRSVWIVARAAEPTPGVMGVYDNEDDAREDWAIRTGRGSRPDLERKYVVESWSVGGGIAPRESNR